MLCWLCNFKNIIIIDVVTPCVLLKILQKKKSARELIGTQKYRKIYVIYDMDYLKQEALIDFKKKLSIVMNLIDQKMDLP